MHQAISGRQDLVADGRSLKMTQAPNARAVASSEDTTGTTSKSITSSQFAIQSSKRSRSSLSMSWKHRRRSAEIHLSR